MKCIIDERQECVPISPGERRFACSVFVSANNQPLQMTEHYRTLCRTHEEYRMAWREGAGPGQFAECPPAPKDRPRRKPKTPGPGTELKQIIAAWQRRFPWFDLSPRKGCGCTDTALKMDRWGSDKCERNMDRIVRRLEVEATKRNLTVPFRKKMARRMVKQAIRRAREKAGE